MERSVPSRLTRTERARNASGVGSGKTIGSEPAADTEGRKRERESARKDTTVDGEGTIGKIGRRGGVSGEPESYGYAKINNEGNTATPQQLQHCDG